MEVYIHQSAVYVHQCALHTQKNPFYTHQSKALFTHNRARFTHTKTFLTHTRALFTHTRDLVTHTRVFLTHNYFYTHQSAFYTHQSACYTHQRPRTVRTCIQVSTNWHLQVHLSLEQSQWGREFKTKGNNATAHIEAQHCRLKLPLEVEDSVNTVLELMLCFSANRQTCMAGIEYLWSALRRPPSGVSVRIFTDSQTRSMLSVAMRTL